MDVHMLFYPLHWPSCRQDLNECRMESNNSLATHTRTHTRTHTHVATRVKKERKKDTGAQHLCSVAASGHRTGCEGLSKDQRLFGEALLRHRTLGGSVEPRDAPACLPCLPASSPLCVFSMSLLVAPILSLLTSRTIVARGDKTCQCRLVSLKDLLLLTALGYLEQRSRKWEKRESKRRGQSMWEKQSGE